MSAADVPSMFETTNEFILKTLPLAAELVTISVAIVDTFATAVLPFIVATFTIFGAAIYYPPKTIAIAIALPVVIPPPLPPDVPLPSPPDDVTTH